MVVIDTLARSLLLSAINSWLDDQPSFNLCQNPPYDHFWFLFIYLFSSKALLYIDTSEKFLFTKKQALPIMTSLKLFSSIRRYACSKTITWIHYFKKNLQIWVVKQENIPFNIFYKFWILFLICANDETHLHVLKKLNNN